MASLEHLNITVADPDAVAESLAALFDWNVRWAGPALGGGWSVHIGNDGQYLALYTPATEVTEAPDHYATQRGLNHIGVVVDDIEATEARVRTAGYTAHSHGDYEPGRRFYLDGPEGIEIEVVSYT